MALNAYTLKSSDPMYTMPFTTVGDEYKAPPVVAVQTSAPLDASRA